MRTALTAVAVTLLLALLLLPLGCGCAKRTRTPLPRLGGVGGQPARDELLAGLESAEEEPRQFACVFITRFKLPGYEAPLRKLATADPVAAVALAVVYRDSQPALAWCQAQGERRQGLRGILGAASGLCCARDVPTALWDGLLELALLDDRPYLLWGLSQLDFEPGGPLKLGSASRAALLKELRTARPPMPLSRRAPYDAVLGAGEGNTVPWAEYISQAGSLEFSATQWACLLRTRQLADWRKLLAAVPVDSPAFPTLAGAAALAAPDGAVGAEEREQWAKAGLEPEYLALLAPSAEAFAERQKLLQALTGKADAVEGGKPQRDAALALLRYRALRQDGDVIACVLDLAPKLEPDTLTAVVATLALYCPEAVSDGQLDGLADLAQPSAAYWLLLAWGERECVLNSRMPALVRVTPGQENVMLVYAYRLRHAQDKVGEDG